NNYLNVDYYQSVYESLLDGDTLTKQKIIDNEYPEITRHVIRSWAESFVPLMLVLSDGDDSESTLDTEDIAAIAQYGWGGNSFPIHTVGLGKFSKSQYLSALALQTNASHAIID